jgi:hypothetical protein
MTQQPDDPLAQLEEWWAIQGYWSNMDCAQANAGFTAPYRGVDPSARPDVQSTEAPEACFQPDHTLDIVEGCV